MEGNDQVQGIWLIAFILQWIVLLLLAFIILSMLRYIRALQPLLLRGHPAASRFSMGERVSNFSLPDLQGRPRDLNSFLAMDKNVVLLFVSPTCRACQRVTKMVAALIVEYGTMKALPCSFVLICTGKETAIKRLVKDLPLNELTVLIDSSRKVFQQYELLAYPATIVVDRNGILLDQALRPQQGWLYKQTGKSQATLH
jgi:peroxiredoxin